MTVIRLGELLFIVHYSSNSLFLQKTRCCILIQFSKISSKHSIRKLPLPQIKYGLLLPYSKKKSVLFIDTNFEETNQCNIIESLNINICVPQVIGNMGYKLRPPFCKIKTRSLHVTQQNCTVIGAVGWGSSFMVMS